MFVVCVCRYERNATFADCSVVDPKSFWRWYRSARAAGWWWASSEEIANIRRGATISLFSLRLFLLRWWVQIYQVSFRRQNQRSIIGIPILTLGVLASCIKLINGGLYCTKSYRQTWHHVLKASTSDLSPFVVFSKLQCIGKTPVAERSHHWSKL